MKKYIRLILTALLTIVSIGCTVQEKQFSLDFAYALASRKLAEEARVISEK